MSFNVKPNILHNYASYTYKFTLYMVPPSEYAKVMSNDDGIAMTDIHTVKFSRKAIILESGATSTNINSVTINSTIGVDFANATTIRIQALQPKGFGFFESIIKACEICGVHGSVMQSAEMFLELTFMGITEDGAQRKNIFTITYPVKIATVGTNIDAAGTSYDINLSFTNYITKEDSYSVTPTIITMTDVNTVEEFFTRFANGINEAYRRDTTSGQAQVNVCRFVVDPAILKFKFKNADGSNPVFDYSMEYSDVTGSSFNIPADTPIPKVIEGVMSNAPDMVDMVVNNDLIVKAIYVEPIVTNGEYIPSMNAYTKIITWYVRLKPVFKDVPVTSTNTGRQIDLLAANGDISKKYNYFYTGENTEVIGIDFNLNSLYASTLNAYKDIFSNYSNQVGYAPSAPPEQSQMLEQESTETTKTNNQFSSKPTRVDGSGSSVYYVDDYNKVDLDLVSKMGARYVKKNANTSGSGSYTSQATNSKRNAYLTDIENIRTMATKPDLLGAITLEIRGDPHWLTPNCVYVKPDGVTSNPRQMNAFYIKVGFPLDETSGKMHVDEFMSKLYQTSGVTSEFNNGKFTQKLNGTLITQLSRKSFEGKFDGK